MSDDILETALGFLTRLSENNSRDWFQTHKSDYEAQVKRPAEALLDQLAAPLSVLAGAPVTPKLFRIHRDLRFSKDKTPYNTHLHLSWSAPDGTAWMFGLSRDYCCAGAGVMEFSKTGLTAWREHVAEHGFVDLSPWRLDDPALKRVPPPYPQDHPQGALMRRKGLLVWHDLGAAERGDPVPVLTRAFEDMEPVRTALAEILTA
ncbi:TIGR02453 family protein [Aliiroseovarius sp.]|uniref:TIGR02453 family protein n=1 Tax=Aliiroseovarius sp. TaxID=1872442 RepID=UPI003BAC81EC